MIAILDSQPKTGEWSSARVAVAEPTVIPNAPVLDIIKAGVVHAEAGYGADELLAVGTLQTTPPLRDVPVGWPCPNVCWRVLLFSIATYLLLRYGLDGSANRKLIPAAIVVGSFMVPLAVTVFFYEMNKLRNISAFQMIKLILLGGALSMIVAIFFAKITPGQYLPPLLAGLTEETAKALALLAMCATAGYRWRLNGLVLGAAVGAGFAGFESAGYATNSLLDGIMEFDPRTTAGHPILNALPDVFASIADRALLAPGGHVIWTAMVGAALWRVKGSQNFELRMLWNRSVLMWWGVAVALHGVWNTDVFHDVGSENLKYVALTVIGWFFVFRILKQSLQEIETVRAAGSKNGHPQRRTP
jgi:protease PrsW